MSRAELRQAAMLSTALVDAACNADGDEAARWRQR